MKKKLLVSLILISLCFNVTMYSYATSVTELEQQKSEAEDKKDELEDKKDQVEAEKSQALKNIEELEGQIADSETKLDELNAKVKELEASIATKEKEIEEAEQKQKEQEKILEKRLVAQYKTGKVSYWSILLNPSSFLDFFSNLHNLEKIAKIDAELIENFKLEKEKLEKAKEELSQQKSEVKTAKAEAEAENVKLKNAKTIKNSQVAKLTEEEKKLQSEIDSYNAAIKNLDNQVTEMLKKAQQQIQSSNGGTGIKFDGSFIWPCNNKIVTSTVKRRWGRWHKGIDIGARYENVYASASGYAYNASNPGGYGTYIMIVHGDGYITLYGHLSSSHISSGQYVKQGQVIATSGNSGASQGAHLHFEIRKCTSINSMFTSGNNFLNPLDYLPGGYTLQAGATTES